MEKRFEIEGQKYSLKNGNLYDACGNQIIDALKKRLLISKLNSKTYTCVGADNDTISSSAVIDNQEFENIGLITQPNNQTDINKAIDDAIGEIDKRKVFVYKGTKTNEEINTTIDLDAATAQDHLYEVYNMKQAGIINQGAFNEEGQRETFKVKKGENIICVEETVIPQEGEPYKRYFWDNFSVGTINFSDIENKPTTIAGYGITDAKIEEGVITLGEDTITPVVEDPNLFEVKEKFGKLKPYKYSNDPDYTTPGEFTDDENAYIDINNSTVFYAGKHTTSITTRDLNMKLQFDDNNHLYLYDQKGTGNKLVVDQEGTVLFNKNIALSANNTGYNSQLTLNDGGCFFMTGNKKSTELALSDNIGSGFNVKLQNKPVLSINESGTYLQYIDKNNNNASLLCIDSNQCNLLLFSPNVSYENAKNYFPIFVAQGSDANSERWIGLRAVPHYSTTSNSYNFVSAYTGNDNTAYTKLTLHGNLVMQTQCNVNSTSALTMPNPTVDSTKNANNSYFVLFYPNQNKMMYYGNGYEELKVNSPNGNRAITIHNDKCVIEKDLQAPSIKLNNIDLLTTLNKKATLDANNRLTNELLIAGTDAQGNNKNFVLKIVNGQITFEEV